MNFNKETARKQQGEYTPTTDLESAHTSPMEEARKDVETVPSQQPEMQAERSGERARAEALEIAVKSDRNAHIPEKKQTPLLTHSHKINKHTLDKNYQNTMKHVQDQMPPYSKAFSKVIHNKIIEMTSETLGNTIARPNAILAGAIGAFIITLGIYLIAKNFGYRLSGSETIAGFILGWVIGLLFDFFRVMITGKRS